MSSLTVAHLEETSEELSGSHRESSVKGSRMTAASTADITGTILLLACWIRTSKILDEGMRGNHGSCVATRAAVLRSSEYSSWSPETLVCWLSITRVLL